MKLRRTLIASLCALGLLFLGATPAAADPVWNLDLHHAETNFAPGGGAGHIEVTTSTDGGLETNEAQRIGAILATAGTYNLSFEGETTTDLPFDADASAVQAALQALPSIGAANVQVSGTQVRTSGDPHYDLTFTGALAETDVSQVTAANGTPRLSIAPEIWLDVANVGDTATSGPITVRVILPAGLSRERVRVDGAGPPAVGALFNDWSCPGSAGDSVIVCTTGDSIARHTIGRHLRILVSVAESAVDPRIVSAKVEGGGAADFDIASERIPISPQPAGFGVIPESFVSGFFESDLSMPVTQSGAHPELFTTAFDFNTKAAVRTGSRPSKEADGSVRNLRVDLPPGFIGDPTAVSECTQAEFTLNVCPFSSQIGRVDLRLNLASGFGGDGWSELAIGLFNLTHPRGAVADLGMAVGVNPIHIKASLDPANDYAITTSVADINETVPPMTQKVTVWGVPADPAHDSQRCPGFILADLVVSVADTSQECSTDHERAPFITVPFSCEEDHSFRLHTYDSWTNPGAFGPDIVHTLPDQITGCEKPRFEPSVKAVPTGFEANAPTGLDVSIQVPQNESADGLAAPPVKSTVVTFPQGMTFNPAFADGLQGCSLAQIGLGTNDPVACPDNSRIGTVNLTTPLLPKPLVGSMYLAKQGENPFGTTFALYMVVADTEDRGVLVKIPGRIDLDQGTGQITTSFDDLPQFPFDDFTLSFRSGQRAPLVTPPVCGRQTIGVQIASYAQPDRALDASNSFVIDEGPGGAPCPTNLGSRPFDPQMNAGTTSSVAGSFAPFGFRLTRKDTEQDISRVVTRLPQGLTAKLAGVEICPDSAIAQVSAAEGTGASESANPHCPLGSLVGTLNAGVGAGASPNYFGGRVFLAGPYNGAPLSFVTVTPAIAGPYDFGSVVVRIAAGIDPRTSEVTATSDVFPPIVHGVLLHIREVRLAMDRDQFTLNPTSCSPMAITAEIFSDLGALATPTDYFQADNCGSLRFRPRLALRLRGGTKRGAHPQLTANLVPRAGDANIRSVSVAFPRSEFLENAHIRTVCTRPDFAADACPAGAIYGKATAYTPILGYPLEANVYLRSSDNLLPDVVPDFRGPPTQPIKFESAGRVDSINGGIRNTFDFIPDAPISRVLFRLQGGKKGLLVNSRDICAHTYRATVRYTAHNGATYTQRPKMVALACKKAKKGTAKRRGHSRAKRAAPAARARSVR